MKEERLIEVIAICAFVLVAFIALLLAFSHVFYSPFLDGLFSYYWTTLESGKPSYAQGDAIQVFGNTRCAATVEFLIDGEPVGTTEVKDGGYLAFLQADVATGTHNLTMRSGACVKSIIIEITAPPCTQDDARECVLSNGCPGKEYCLNGGWTECTPLRKLCQPGTTRTCTLGDGCHIGSQECNECGSAWGPCK